LPNYCKKLISKNVHNNIYENCITRGEKEMFKKIVSVLVMLLILLSFTGIATASTTKKISSIYWDNNDNPSVDKVVITIDTNITYSTGSYYSVTKITTIGTVESFTDEEIKVKCLETINFTHSTPKSGNITVISNKTYYQTLYR
jgi:hypothetical protein